MFAFFRRHFSRERYFYSLFYSLLGVTPSNVELYKLALLHRSSSQESDGHQMNNERLEFLGDAVLETIFSELVFLSDPYIGEGEMTRTRSRLVSRENLNLLASCMHLDRYIVVRPRNLINTKNSIRGDAFEALVGALYLDKGYNRTFDVVVNLFEKKLNINKIISTEKDFKSRIIEWAQKEHVQCEFRTAEAEDYTDANPSFRTELYVNSEKRGEGLAKNKKISEQRAARQLYDILAREGTFDADDE